MISAVLKIKHSNVEKYKETILGRRISQQGADLGEEVSRLSKEQE